MSSLVNNNAATFTSATTKGLNMGTSTAGQLLTCVLTFGTITVSNLVVTDTLGDTWAVAYSQAGSNPPNRKVVIAWAVAGSTGANGVTATWTEAQNGSMEIDEFVIGGSGITEVAAFGGFEETSTGTSHNSMYPGGLDAIADDVMLAGGVTDGSSGAVTAGSGWTAHLMNNSIRQYRLPTGAVNDNRGDWLSTNSRTAVSAMAIFRRVALPPEPEILFQYPRVRTRGLNSGLN